MSLGLEGFRWALACFAVAWLGVLGAIASLGIGLAWSTYAPARQNALVARALAVPLATIGLGALGLLLLSWEAARLAIDVAALPFIAVSGVAILAAPVALWPRGVVPWSGWWLGALLGGLFTGGPALWVLSKVVFSDPGALLVLSFPAAGLLSWIVYRVLRRCAQ